MIGDADADDWWANPLAPLPGTSLGPLAAIPDGEMREFQFGEGRRVFSLLVARRGEGARAYVNVCPHVWLPLTFRGTRLMSADGQRIVCSNHFAEFAVDDGRALSGPVESGRGLTRVPVHVDADGNLVVGQSPSTPRKEGTT